jgi:hypothetical protein
LGSILAFAKYAGQSPHVEPALLLSAHITTDYERQDSEDLRDGYPRPLNILLDSLTRARVRSIDEGRRVETDRP